MHKLQKALLNFPVKHGIAVNFTGKYSYIHILATT